MAPAPRIWTFIFKDLAIPRQNPSSPSSVTLWPSHLGQTDPSVLAKLNIVYSCLTHAPSVSFSPRSGSEDGEHQPLLAKRPRVHADADLNQNVSVFRRWYFVAQNVQFYLQPLLPWVLCLTIITASIHLHPRHLLRFWSYASGSMLKKTQGRSPFHTPVDPVQLLLNASSQALILKHQTPIHKIIVTMMLLR